MSVQAQLDALIPVAVLRWLTKHNQRHPTPGLGE